MGVKDTWSRWFGRGPDVPAEVPDVAPEPVEAAPPKKLPRIPADRNPLGIDLVDLRPVTHALVATSTDPQMASNAVSYGTEDGRCFVGQAPIVADRAEAALRYVTDLVLPDGVLFNPRDMDHKWALYLHEGRILCVRSWQRRVVATADVRREAGAIVVGPIVGALREGAEPDWTVRAFDFLLRTHALDAVWPTPDPIRADGDDEKFALACFSLFGRRATVAGFGAPPASRPARPLRTHSLLHIAAARGDQAEVRAQVAAGTPVDVLAADGLPPLQWALAADLGVLECLLALGAAVDGRSAEGATALMTCAQADGAERVAFFLDRGADPNARDHRGFTALHRASETGRIQAVRLLLARGADPSTEAHGHTARSLAELRGQTEIAALLAEQRRP